MFQSLFVYCHLSLVFRSLIQFSTKKKALHGINCSFHFEIVWYYYEGGDAEYVD